MFHGITLAHAKTRLKILPLLSLFILPILLFGCGSETTVTKEGACIDTADGGVLCLKLVDENGVTTRNMTSNSSATLIATLKNADNEGIEGVAITFTTDVGQLAGDGKGLTGTNGEANIIISSGLTPGVVSATASIAGTADTGLTTPSYNFVIGGTTGTPTVTKEGACEDTASGGVLCLRLINSAGAIIQDLDTDTSATLVAIVKSANNQGIENQAVTFSTTVGTIETPTSNLTETNGEKRITFTAGAIAASGNLTATIDDNGSQLVTTLTLNIKTSEAPAVSNSISGAIEFISATPTNIALRNTGGLGLTEFSTVEFRIIGTDGRPMANRIVNFSLNTDVGGIDLDPISAPTSATGFVSTTLQAGNIPTSVRVTASSQVTDLSGNSQTIFTQSDQLIISTGLPDQNSMSLAVSVLNPEAWDLDGVTVDVTARLADHFNNFVPDGTAVYFTTEGGAIQPSCFTADGACTVVWRSQNPRPADHRITILATAIGTESFHDTNSDGKYSLADGEPYADSSKNSIYDEAFTDSNSNSIFDEPFPISENGRYDVGETFTDGTNGIYDGAFTHSSGTFVPAEAFIDLGNGTYDLGEPITNDINSDGIYDSREIFEDADADGIFDVGETYTDANGNGEYDPGDSYTDLGDGEWNEGESFTDAANGVWDSGESFVDAVDSIYELGEFFIDHNGNGVYDGNGNNPAGELTFVDSNNGNTLYDGAGSIPGGESYTDANSNAVFDGPGFPDLAEPYLDSNENGQYDIGEMYVDTNNNGTIELIGDGKYNGILCIENNNCSDEQTLHIRKSINIVMASSSAKFLLTDTAGNLTYSTNDSRFNVSGQPIDISYGGGISLQLRVTDTAGQVMPAGTTISISVSGAKVNGITSFTVPSTLGSSYRLRGPTDSEKAEEIGHVLNFTITDSNIDETEESAFTITITSPNGLTTAASVPFRT